MLTSKWHINRIGLVDFWYYGNEVFEFQNGHMLLRGSNGSGKSVTMQSFIPLLLDGNKSSERLDAFGTKSRKIENYMFEEGDGRNERIGYLWMEFKRESSEIYTTIGMGLYARRNQRVDSWYFVLTDNRRIGIDIELTNKNIALSKIELKHRIGAENIIESQKEYMAKVNQTLFKFHTLNEYREVIKLLIRLRTPKLSNELKPTMLNDILTSSLQTLTDDDLRPMSEAISNMDALKEQLDALKRSYRTSQTMNQPYKRYNQAVLYEKAKYYKDKLNELAAAKKEYQLTLKKIEKTKTSIQDHEQKKLDLENEKRLLEEEKMSLKAENIFNIKNEQHALQDKINQTTLSLEKKKQQLDDERDNERTFSNKLKSHVDKNELKIMDINECIKEMDKYSETIHFDEHLLLKNELLADLSHPVSFDYTIKQINEKTSKIREGLKEIINVDRCENEVAILMEKLNDCEIELKKAENQQRIYEGQYHEIVAESKEKISVWNQQNEQLKLSDDELQKIYGILDVYDIEHRFNAVLDVINSKERIIRNELDRMVNTYNHQLHLNNDEINDNNHLLQQFLNSKDTPPVRSENVKQNRSVLKEQQIDFIPFYELIEFDSQMDHDSKNRIEEALSLMGLLDALVVSDKDKDFVLSHKDSCADTYLFTSLDFDVCKALFSHIKSSEELQAALIQMTAGQSESALLINNDTFRQGLLSGNLSGSCEAKYIGVEARKQYRDSQIAKIQSTIQELINHKEKLETEKAKVNFDIELLDKERNRFIKDDDLDTAYQEVKKAEMVTNNKQSEVNSKQLEVRMMKEKLYTLRVKAQAYADQLNLPCTSAAFDQAEKDAAEYHNLLRDLKSNHDDYRINSELINDYTNHVENAKQRIADLVYELNTLTNTLSYDQSKNEMLLKHLESEDYKKIEIRVNDIFRRLNTIDPEKEKVIHDLGQLETTLNNDLESAERYQHEEEQLKLIADQAEAYFMEDYKLGLTAIESDTTSSRVLADLCLASVPAKKVDDYATELQNSFYTNRDSLQDYSLTLIKLFDEADRAQNCQHYIVTGRFAGKRIDLGELMERLKNEIENQEHLLEENDRVLFEEILVNNISKQIRIHIQSSQNWVKEMNKYMAAMNTSSGLSLGLIWKSKKAETAEQLDTNELVDLLNHDVTMMKDSDIAKLSAHFRSKIEIARKLADSDDSTKTFHEVMREVMDYRQWFEFKIMYQRTGETKKEMTNNAFFAFSGGEKALSMYIPLFSAVAAKYRSAASDAPMLIALDEAFAGIDDKNIANLFDLIGKFEFDYILNSQVLWGDYETVKDLAIYDLYRPENAKFITIMAYVWNGVKRKAVTQ